MPESGDPRQGRHRLARFISNKGLFRLALVILWESGRSCPWAGIRCSIEGNVAPLGVRERGAGAKLVSKQAPVHRRGFFVFLPFAGLLGVSRPGLEPGT